MQYLHYMTYFFSQLFIRLWKKTINDHVLIRLTLQGQMWHAIKVNKFTLFWHLTEKKSKSTLTITSDTLKQGTFPVNKY